MVNLIDLLHQKIELFRLEQRYTRRRNRRSTFVSDAQYVDGEYIYSNNSSNTSSKQNTGGSGSGASGSDSERERERDGDVGGERGVNAMGRSPTTAMPKGLGSKRLSRIGMAMDWRKGKNVGGEGVERVSVREVRWEEERR